MVELLLWRTTFPTRPHQNPQPDQYHHNNGNYLPRVPDRRSHDALPAKIVSEP
jgi:hypothetical protein